MLSMAHEVLVDLFKNRPSLAAEILAEVLGVPIPSYTQARLVSTELNEIQPAEYRADAVVVLLDGDAPVRVIIVEEQLTPDPASASVGRPMSASPAQPIAARRISSSWLSIPESPDGARSRSSSVSPASSYARRCCAPPRFQW